MPRILGFKEIAGDVYVKLDITKESSPVHLYTDHEYQAELSKVEGVERSRCVRIINAARSGEVDSDLRCIRSWIEGGEEPPQTE